MPKTIEFLTINKKNPFYSARINLMGRILPLVAFFLFIMDNSALSNVLIYPILEYGLNVDYYEFFTNYSRYIDIAFILIIVIDALTIAPLIFAKYDYQLEDSYQNTQAFYARYKIPVVGQCSLCGRAIPQFYGRRKKKYLIPSLQANNLCFMTDHAHLRKYKEIGDQTLLGEVGAALHIINKTKVKAKVRLGIEGFYIIISLILLMIYFLDLGEILYMIPYSYLDVGGIRFSMVSVFQGLILYIGIGVGQKGGNIYPVVNRVYFNHYDDVQAIEIMSHVTKRSVLPMLGRERAQSYRQRSTMARPYVGTPSPRPTPIQSQVPAPQVPLRNIETIRQETKEYLLRLSSIYDEIEFGNIIEKTGIDRTSLRELIEDMIFGGEMNATVRGSLLIFKK